ncbi:hypothetical protein WMY93_011347 [Mugilogobius chulae]|uniref:C2H2-type domain-containing protein n=1 Tax=Mugilogobius chulae TaxID=88201 RepID=A0AAW0PDG6_9GOBI
MQTSLAHHHHHPHHHHHELPLTPPAEPSSYSFELSPNSSGRHHLPGGHVDEGQQWWSLPQTNASASNHPFTLSRQLVLGHQPQIAALLQGTSKGLLELHSTAAAGVSAPTARDNGGGLEFGKKRLHICHIPECGKVYKKTSHLKAHLRWHAGERPFICNWLFCGKSFTRSDELQRHPAHTHWREALWLPAMWQEVHEERPPLQTREDPSE